MNSFLNKSFGDCQDRNRKLIPIKEDGKDFVCRVYVREPKQARMKERREREDGNGTELVVVYKDIEVPWDYVGNVKIGQKLFFVKLDREYDQLGRIGFRMM